MIGSAKQKAPAFAGAFRNWAFLGFKPPFDSALLRSGPLSHWESGCRGWIPLRGIMSLTSYQAASCNWVFLGLNPPFDSALLRSGPLSHWESGCRGWI